MKKLNNYKRLRLWLTVILSVVFISCVTMGWISYKTLGEHLFYAALVITICVGVPLQFYLNHICYKIAEEEEDLFRNRFNM